MFKKIIPIEVLRSIIVNNSTQQLRLNFLTLRLHDLDANAQSISSQKMNLMYQAQNLSTETFNPASGISFGGTATDNTEWAIDGDDFNFEDMSFDNPTENQQVNKEALAEQLKEISEQEKILDMQLIQINTERTAVKTERDSLKEKMDNDNKIEN